MKKKVIAILAFILGLLVTAGGVYGYTLSKINSNKITVGIGEFDNVTATLDVLNKDEVLIPDGYVISKDNETDAIILKLNIISDVPISFYVYHNLDNNKFRLDDYNTNYKHTSNGNYTIEYRLRLLDKDVDYKSFEIFFEIVRA